jgi:hypothetical protein
MLSLRLAWDAKTAVCQTLAVSNVDGILIVVVTPVSETNGEMTRSIRRRRFNRIRPALIPVLLILLSLVVTVVQVPGHRGLSPFDEYVYLDYLAKVPSEVAVHTGEKTGLFAREQLGCRGLRILAPAPDARCQRAEAEQNALFPWNGVTSADLYTPFYFVVTRVLAEPLVWLGVDLTDAGRSTGFVWMAIGSVALYLALRRLKVKTLPAFGASVLVIGSAGVYWADTYVSTDATAIAFGGLLLYQLTRVEQTKRGYVWFVALSVLATLFKLQNLLAVAVVCLVLVFRAAILAFDEQTTLGSRVCAWISDRRTIAAILAILLSGVAEAAWNVYRASTAVGPAPPQTPEHLGFLALTSEFFKFLGYQGTAPGLGGSQGLWVTTVVQGLSIAGVLGLAAVSQWRSAESTYSLSVLTVALLGGPILAVTNLLATGYYFELPSRYGLSLLPLIIGCTALLCSKRKGTEIVFGIIGIVTFAASLLLPQG